MNMLLNIKPHTVEGINEADISSCHAGPIAPGR